MDSIRSIARARVSLAPLLLLATALGCSGKDRLSPGTQLGTFHVSGKLLETTCGKAPDPWEFDVRLNHDGSTLYWIQGSAPIEGHVDTNAKAQLKSDAVYDVRPADAKMKKAACSLSRADVLNVTLSAADAKPTSDPGQTTTFAGGLVYTFTPTEGSDCEDQVSDSGGGFDTLPCSVQYDLTGTFKSPPKY